MADHTLPFGRYRNKPLRQVPVGYLLFLSGLQLYGPLRFHVCAELDRRRARGFEAVAVGDLPFDEEEAGR
jgi:hypothetical protein